MDSRVSTSCGLQQGGDTIGLVFSGVPTKMLLFDSNNNNSSNSNNNTLSVAKRRKVKKEPGVKRSFPANQVPGNRGNDEVDNLVNYIENVLSAPSSNSASRPVGNSSVRAEQAKLDKIDRKSIKVDVEANEKVAVEAAGTTEATMPAAKKETETIVSADSAEVAPAEPPPTAVKNSFDEARRQSAPTPDDSVAGKRNFGDQIVERGRQRTNSRPGAVQFNSARGRPHGHHIGYDSYFHSRPQQAPPLPPFRGRCPPPPPPPPQRHLRTVVYNQEFVNNSFHQHPPIGHHNYHRYQYDYPRPRQHHFVGNGGGGGFRNRLLRPKVSPEQHEERLWELASTNRLLYRDLTLASKGESYRRLLGFLFSLAEDATTR